MHYCTLVYILMYNNAFHVLLSPFNNRLNGPSSFYLYQWQHYHNSTCSQSKAACWMCQWEMWSRHLCRLVFWPRGLCKMGWRGVSGISCSRTWRNQYWWWCWLLLSKTMTVVANCKKSNQSCPLPWNTTWFTCTSLYKFWLLGRIV